MQPRDLGATESSPDIPLESVAPNFDSWYRREYPRAVRYAYLLTRDERDAEDLAQDAFVAASRKWREVGSYDRPDLWIRRLIANRSKNRLRKLYRGSRALIRLQGTASFTMDFTSRADESHVLDALAQLPERQRIAVALTYLEDRDLNEVADVLGCSVETARTHRRRGEDRLRTLLGESEP